MPKTPQQDQATQDNCPDEAITQKQQVDNWPDEAIAMIAEELRESWPSPLVARSEVSLFSGGLLNPRTLANLDSSDEGPPRIRIGRKIGYPRDPLIRWFLGRYIKVNRREGQGGRI